MHSKAFIVAAGLLGMLAGDLEAGWRPSEARLFLGTGWLRPQHAITDGADWQAGLHGRAQVCWEPLSWLSPYLAVSGGRNPLDDDASEPGGSTGDASMNCVTGGLALQHRPAGGLDRFWVSAGYGGGHWQVDPRIAGTFGGRSSTGPCLEAGVGVDRRIGERLTLGLAAGWSRISEVGADVEATLRTAQLTAGWWIPSRRAVLLPTR